MPPEEANLNSRRYLICYAAPEERYYSHQSHIPESFYINHTFSLRLFALFFVRFAVKKKSRDAEGAKQPKGSRWLVKYYWGCNAYGGG